MREPHAPGLFHSRGSPALARSLLGKPLDAEVQVQAPGGLRTWYIVAIDYP